jgi:hypothetical protein
MSDQADLAAILSKGSASWASIEMRMEATFPQAKPQSNGFTWSKEFYIEKATGERYYERISRTSRGKTSRSEDYSDGKKFTKVGYDDANNRVQERVMTTASFGREFDLGARHSPYPLRIFHSGFEPLTEALPKGKGLGPSVVLDRPCLRFELGGTGLGSSKAKAEIYHLDRETGVPLKIERIMAGDRRIVWEALSLDKVQGRHFPLRSRLLGLDGRVRIEFKVTELKYDVKYDKETFDPSISRRVQAIGAPLQAPSPIREAPAPEQDQAPPPMSSIRVLDAGIEGSPVGGAAEAHQMSLGLGGAILSVVLLARTRRRGRAPRGARGRMAGMR